MKQRSVKIHYIVLGLVIFTGFRVQAAGDSTWEWDLATRVRWQSHAAPDADNSGGTVKAQGSYKAVEQKTTLGANIVRGERARGRIGLIHAFNWGDNGAGNSGAEFNSPASSGTTGAAQPNGTSDRQNLLLVNEAYMWSKITDAWSVSAGRMGLELADGRVMSRNSDSVTPYAWDSAVAHWDHDLLTVSVIVSKIFDGYMPTGATSGGGISSPFTNDPETKIYGVTIDFKEILDAAQTLHFHFIHVLTDELSTGTAGESFLRWAMAGNGEAFGLDFNGTIAMVEGDMTCSAGNSLCASDTDVSRSGMMYDGEIGYRWPHLWGLRGHVGYHWDTGDKDGHALDSTGSTDTDNTTYSPFFYDRHRYSGLMDVVEWGNLTYLRTGASVKLAEINLALEYLQFAKTTGRDATLNRGPHGAFLTTGGAGVVADEKDIGAEIDLSANYKMESGLVLGARYGLFIPGALFVAPNDEAYTQVMVDGTLTF